MPENIIKTEIDGVEVEAKVCHRSSRDFQIEITKPYQSIQGGLHIPHFSGGRFSFDGEYGDQRILHELNRLYGLGSYLADNMDVLREKVRDLDKEIARVSAGKITKDEFKEIRRKLRRQLKRGEITNRYHQKVLRWWKNELNSLDMHIFLNLEDPFFENNFPMVVPCGTRKQVLKILRDGGCNEKSMGN